MVLFHERENGCNVSTGEWIHRFCTKLGNDFFCEIEKEYVRDQSNLVGLDEEVSCFSQALSVILDRTDKTDDDFVRFSKISYQPNGMDKTVAKAAEHLYGLIHARYILSERGCKKMLYKYLQGDFGHCPRVLCSNANVLPIGLSDQAGEEMVKIYCPKCNEVYEPRQLKYCYIDGAYFGTSLPHMVFMVYPDYRPDITSEHYVPRLYGFKLHGTSYSQNITENRKFIPKPKGVPRFTVKKTKLK
ncbi:predicted protein [Nematostella vectensis]|uniref:Casein kinase II subunit beta n=1 Tax=Nematostella vectensis TaxID=45351 RepID=A7S6V3_NEMVE|nr:predicted protein [Nematostella vectensis]|eukprot:XP_001632687.1 predicted protein [Nematostella vectensis]